MNTSLRGVYISNFGKISVKIQFCESYTLIVAQMGWRGGVDLRGENLKIGL